MRFFAIPGTLILAACVSGERAQKACDSQSAMHFIGEFANRENGAAIKQATGATSFQWVPEDGLVTTDYGYRRVRVYYNQEMEIIAISCG